MPIFDQGYQHWSGPLTPFRWRWLAVARHGVRAMLTSRIVRGLLLISWMPAIAMVAALAFWGLLEQKSETILNLVSRSLPAEVIASPQQFRGPIWTIVYKYFFKTQLFTMILVVLTVGPSLISRDLRFNALPLYFSRPIRRFDYFVGKLAIIGAFIAATTVLPAIVAYIFGIAFSLDIGVIRDTYRVLWASIAYGLTITLSAGTLMLALSSLSRRSIYVGIAWAGFIFLTWMVSGILLGIQYHANENEVLQTQMEAWLSEHPAPEGVEMHGIYPNGRRAPRDQNANTVDDKLNKWNDEWYAAYRQARRAANSEATQAMMTKSDWRPTIAYMFNLERIGDALFNVDGAFVTIGKAIQKPQKAALPFLRMHAGNKLPKGLTDSGERALADSTTWQFPWQWSAGVLLGLWLLSVLVLSSRVKSLDRLK